MASEIKVDTISEKTSTNGVTIDSLSIKDGGLVAEGNIDVNGNNLVLDANANTYLDAGTDDTIKVYVSGAEDLRIAANAINVLSGTTLTIDSGATITNSGTANGFGALAGIDDQTSSNDDQLTITDTAVIINEDSDDLDFRVESNGQANLLVTEGSTNTILSGIGAAETIGGAVHQVQVEGLTHDTSSLSLTRNSNSAGSAYLSFCKTRGTSVGDDTIIQDNDFLGSIVFGGGDGADRATYGAQIQARINGTPGENDMPTELIFSTTADGAESTTERMQIGQNGEFFFGTANFTDNDLADNSSGAGLALSYQGRLTSARSGATVAYFNRQGDGGNVISINQAGGVIGTISVSGSTVSYNAFSGSHWSRLADNSQPTILRGTVMESIATMCDWYACTFTTNPDELDGDGNAKEGSVKRVEIPLPDGKNVGDVIKHTYDGVEYDATIVKEENEQLPMCKISDTENSKAVYGVFCSWDNEPDDGVNDMLITALGAFVVRIHKDETVAIGDYLQSKGDGTAKVQADDILRASTIGKVTSTTKTITHGDGSYCVPCTLHCG